MGRGAVVAGTVVVAAPLPAGRPHVLLGRLIDVAGATASFPLDAAPGRAVAILGPDPVGAGILAAATLRRRTP